MIELSFSEKRCFMRLLNFFSVISVLLFSANTSLAQYSIFSPSESPASGIENDGNGVEVGVKVKSLAPGFVTAVKYYKGSGITGTRTAHVWTSSGVLLSQAIFTGETSSGWQTIALPNPVKLSPDSSYVISCFSSSGDYMYTSNSFSARIGLGPIVALSSSESGGNGVYSYGSSSTFPVTSYASSNYFVDVVFLLDSSGGGVSGHGDSNYVAKFIDSTTLGNSLIYDNGTSVGIGTKKITDTSHRLFVERGIRTRKVTVDIDSWPDYVFESSYTLPGLDSVRKYVSQFGHLPGVPSAEKVSTSGVNLGESQAALLQKIEELYLYLFKLNDEMKDLREENIRLRKTLQERGQNR